MNRVKSEKDWQAESDANTLVEAERIKKDKIRLTAASKAAQKMTQELTEKAKITKKVAKK